MVAAAFVAPYLLDATTRFVEAAATLPGVELAVVTCEPANRIPAKLRGSLAAHWRIDDPLDAGQIAAAVEGLSAQRATRLDGHASDYSPIDTTEWSPSGSTLAAAK